MPAIRRSASAVRTAPTRLALITAVAPPDCPIIRCAGLDVVANGIDPQFPNRCRFCLPYATVIIARRDQSVEYRERDSSRLHPRKEHVQRRAKEQGDGELVHIT